MASALCLHATSLLPHALLTLLRLVILPLGAALYVRRVYILILTILISFVSIALFVVLRLFLCWLRLLLLDRSSSLWLTFLVLLLPLSFVIIVVLSLILTCCSWNIRRGITHLLCLMLQSRLVVGVHHLLRRVHMRWSVLLLVHWLVHGDLYMLLVIVVVLLLMHLILLVIHEDILVKLLLNRVLHLILLQSLEWPE